MPRNSHAIGIDRAQNTARGGGEKDKQHDSRRLFEVCVGLVLATSIILFGAAAANHFRPSTLWIVLLFFIPIAVQFWGLRSLWKRYENNKERSAFSNFYLWTMAICLLSYSGLWLRYSMWEKQFHWLNKTDWNESYWRMYAYFGNSVLSLEVFSYLALAMILVLLVLAVKMTLAIIEGDCLAPGSISERKGRDFWNIDYLRSGASQEPFLALLFFFTVFLGVSYLFGLALAFHDKSRPPVEPALYMKNLFAPQTYTTEPPTTETQNQSAPSKQTEPYLFKFGEARALLPGFDEQPQRMTKRQIMDWQKSEKGNQSTLNSLIPAILNETKNHSPLRIVLTGFADKEDIHSSAYKSNYELGMARAENTKYVIVAELTSQLHSLPKLSKERWRDIEWLCLSASNERGDSERAVSVKLEKSTEDKITTQLIPYLNSEHTNPLGLMDYVYFANYTITTTGYGDIIPNDHYTKFICSIANICEVFFLVVFFNVLLSLKVDRDGNRMAINSREEPDTKIDPPRTEAQKRRSTRTDLETLSNRVAELEGQFKNSTTPKAELPNSGTE